LTNFSHTQSCQLKNPKRKPEKPKKNSEKKPDNPKTFYKKKPENPEISGKIRKVDSSAHTSQS
jgi:hypothetical protein